MSRPRRRPDSLVHCYRRPWGRYLWLRCRDTVHAIRSHARSVAALDRTPGDMALSYGWRAVVVGLLGTLAVALITRAILTGAIALVAPRPWLLATVNIAVTAGAATAIVVRRGFS